MELASSCSVLPCIWIMLLSSADRSPSHIQDVGAHLPPLSSEWATGEQGSVCHDHVRCTEKVLSKWTLHPFSPKSAVLITKSSGDVEKLGTWKKAMGFPQFW